MLKHVLAVHQTTLCVHPTIQVEEAAENSKETAINTVCLPFESILQVPQTMHCLRKIQVSSTSQQLQLRQSCSAAELAVSIV
jgi:hypothetical protein